MPKLAKGEAMDLTCQRYGRLTVISAVETGDDGAVWLCRCDCGGTKVASSSNLLYGRVKSCGCMPRGKKKKTEETP